MSDDTRTAASNAVDLALLDPTESGVAHPQRPGIGSATRSLLILSRNISWDEGSRLRSRARGQALADRLVEYQREACTVIASTTDDHGVFVSTPQGRVAAPCRARVR